MKVINKTLTTEKVAFGELGLGNAFSHHGTSNTCFIKTSHEDYGDNAVSLTNGKTFRIMKGAKVFKLDAHVVITGYTTVEEPTEEPKREEEVEYYKDLKPGDFFRWINGSETLVRMNNGYLDTTQGFHRKDEFGGLSYLKMHQIVRVNGNFTDKEDTE